MLLVYAVIAAVLIGYIKGGRLAHYIDQPLEMVYLPALAFMIEACFGLMYKYVSLPPSEWLCWAVRLEYLLLALFILSNWRRTGMKMLGFATLANFVVIAVNDFRMPVSPFVYDYPKLAGLVARIQSGELMEYVLVGWDGPLWYMGDTIPMFGGLASVGDILMAIAMIQLIPGLMKKKRRKKRSLESV